ncbi:hypothetical protein MXB_3946 [Myxobolus squamalis]|nr:hypothetical protein MXB_3946 [Myxobolus squamalis]
MSENNNALFEPRAWRTDSFVELIHICTCKLKNPSRSVLLDATLIIKSIRNLGSSELPYTLFENVPLHYFNLNILQSLKFGDLIIKFISNCQKIDEIFLTYFFKYFCYGLSHKNFCQLFEHAHQNIHSENISIIKLLVDLSQYNDPILLNYWYFANISNDDDITIEYDSDLISKTGISIIFEISTFKPLDDDPDQFIPNMPILW